MMYLASGSTVVIIWIALLVAMSLINANKRRKKAQESGTEESWGKTLFEALKEASKELSHDDDNASEEQQTKREIVQDKQYDEAYDSRQKATSDRDHRTGKRLTESDRSGDDEGSHHDTVLSRPNGRNRSASRREAVSRTGEVEARPFQEEYASLPEVAAHKNSPKSAHNSAHASKIGKASHLAKNGVKTADKSSSDAICDEIADSEIADNNTSIKEEFDIRKAIIFSEIIRPKFDEEYS